MTALPGLPYPLGVRWDGRGVNVAVYSELATAIELCLFDAPAGAAERTRIRLPARTGRVWHGYVPEIGPGQLYGLRVHGPWEPGSGRRCNPRKLLIDPYARALTANVEWNAAVIPPAGAAMSDEPAAADSAPFVPKALVVDDRFDWEEDRPPLTPWNRTVIYEAHVRGLTARHPGVEPALRGTYLGLAAPPVVAHLKSLGVTALELLPVQHFLSEPALSARGLVNAWGYNPIAFAAPHAAYATGDRGQQVTEFKAMVKALHAAGIEVLLDVVFNHTAEGNQLGPHLSLKGLDNPTWYRLQHGEAGSYVDYTGCGNSLNAPHPAALRLVADSLRTWVESYHVDGFRFDLAPVLARGWNGEHLDAFWNTLLQDPLLSRVKLIVEPWDLGPDGDRSGRFPPEIAEWNGRFRDTVRRFWRGDSGQIAPLAYRLSGSSDLYAGGPSSSINFVTCHDGFTLADLVAYERKHNEANGEDNRDGTDANWSRNWGVEGPTDDPEVLALRARVQRSLLATAILSQGVVMLCAGDELGQTQAGNNNAYCQDELSWIEWELDEARAALLGFARKALALVSEHPVLRRNSFLQGRARGELAASAEGAGGAAIEKDVYWLRADGQELTRDDWHDADRHVLGMLLPGHHADERDDEEPAATLLLLLNGGPEPVELGLPTLAGPGHWEILLDTTDDAAAGPAPPQLAPHSLLLLRFVEDAASVS